MLLYDAADGLETQPGALSDTLGGEERLEDMRLDFRRNSRSVVGYFHQQTIQFTRRADAQFALAIHSVDGVVDQISPDLVQLAAAHANLRQRTVEIELYVNALLEAVPQHEQRAFEAFVDVHFLVGALVQISVLFNGTHQIGDAAGGVLDLIEQRADSEKSGDAPQEIRPRLSGKLVVYPVEPRGFATRIHQGGRQIPGPRDSVTQQASRNGFLAIAPFQRIHGRGRSRALRQLALQCRHGRALFGRERVRAQPGSGLAKGLKRFAQAGYCPPRGRRRIVQLMCQAGRDLAQRGHLFLLVLQPGEVADAV